MSRRKYAAVGSLIVAVIVVVVTKNLVFIAAPFIALLFLKSLDLQKGLSRANERIETLEQSFNDHNIFVLDKFKIIEGSVNKLAPSKTTIDSRDLLKKTEYNRQKIEKVNHDLVLVGKEYRDEIGALYASNEEICQSVDRISLDLKSLKQNFESEIQSKLVSLINTCLSDGSIENAINEILESGSPVISEFLKHTEDFVQVRIDKSLDEQFKIIKQLLSQTYSYDLVIDRLASRQVFMDALKVSQQRLILVCPWISTSSINSEVEAAMEDALVKGVLIDIKWGYSQDIIREYSSTTKEYLLKIRELKPDEEWKYSGIKLLKDLQEKYPKLLKLTLLGTHEKIIICDQKFAMFGSHNFMTSLAPTEREMGIKTDDSEIISKLIKRFDSSEVNKFTNVKTNQKPKLKKIANANNYN
ncbi:phospholipase D-like domain-containing protein [Chamaesiphon sp.]|uniref:phospholipase D-like domain-containing protein n=1 Tax=Chamaesiphon sp. TaxID=2814140 RepID=UPI0035932FA5